MKYIISILPKQLQKHNSPQNSLNHPTPKFSTKSFISSLLHTIILQAIKPFWLHICYFTILTIFGYLALKLSNPRTDFNPANFDLFFTSASASTVASLSTVEMEVFSNTQLIIMLTLIFLGGETFISLLSLQLRRFKFIPSSSNTNSCILNNQEQKSTVELGSITVQKPLYNDQTDQDQEKTRLLHKSIKSLGNVVTGYILVIHVLGTILVHMYINFTPSAKNVLEKKGLVLQTFSIFTTISTFSNCGFIPTNENMIVFRNNPGLLLILTPVGLIGGTLYPPCLRLTIWVIKIMFRNRKEYSFMLEKCEELDYGHLMSSKECWFLVETVLGLLGLQFGMFCGMEWSWGVMEGMNNWYEKVVGSLFQTANVRHGGESVVDLSLVSSAILVMFILMMYLPPYTSFLPIGYQRQQEDDRKMHTKKMKMKMIQNVVFSNLSYLTIFVMIICITERKSLKEDPLNFNVLNIVFEIISAYGSVGFSTGYSCKRRLKLDESCVEKSYGLGGWFSKEGKFTLILVMFYGRLRKFNFHGGQAWRLI